MLSFILSVDCKAKFFHQSHVLSTFSPWRVLVVFSVSMSWQKSDRFLSSSWLWSIKKINWFFLNGAIHPLFADRWVQGLALVCFHIKFDDSLANFTASWKLADCLNTLADSLKVTPEFCLDNKGKKGLISGRDNSEKVLVYSGRLDFLLGAHERTE